MTEENLHFCSGLLDGMKERQEEFHETVRQYPLEVTVDHELLQYRIVLDSKDQVDLLLFGFELLVRTVRAVKAGVASTV